MVKNGKNQEIKAQKYSALPILACSSIFVSTIFGAITVSLDV